MQVLRRLRPPGPLSGEHYPNTADQQATHSQASQIHGHASCSVHAGLQYHKYLCESITAMLTHPVTDTTNGQRLALPGCWHYHHVQLIAALWATGQPRLSWLCVISPPALTAVGVREAGRHQVRRHPSQVQMGELGRHRCLLIALGQLPSRSPHTIQLAATASAS